MENHELTLQELKENMAFVGSVLNAEPVTNEAFSTFTKLLNVDYTNYANKNDALAEEAAALLTLQNVQKDLQLAVNCQPLYTKNIVALGGGFSCGKSSFINSLFQNKEVRLPTGINPVTAISAYIIAGQKARITGYSYTGGQVAVSKQMFKKLTHEKMKSFAFNIKKILPYLIIETVLSDDFKHICFIDTPGYNPGAESESDRQASIDYIKQASALIWVIGAESGTLPNDDYEMLSRILKEDPNKKIYIICNKADLKSQEEVQGICMEIAGQLDMSGIPYEGIMPYSSNKPYDPARLPVQGAVGKNLQEFFASLNVANKGKATEAAEKIHKVFADYIRADNERITYLSRQQKDLNKINLKVFADIERKEADIAYYESRMDERFKDSCRNRQDTDSHSYAHIITKMINEYPPRIKEYEDDIIKAKQLYDKMIDCVGAVFNTRISLPLKTDDIDVEDFEDSGYSGVYESTETATVQTRETSPEWHIVTSWDQITGVWESEAKDSYDWNVRYEIYEDGVFYTGKSKNCESIVKSYEQDCNMDAETEWVDIFNHHFVSQQRRLEADRDIADFCVDECAKYTIAVMIEYRDENRILDYSSFEIHQNGTVMREYVARDGRCRTYRKQDDRFISLSLRCAAGVPEQWKPVTEYSRIAGVWEQFQKDSAGRLERYTISTGGQYELGYTVECFDQVRNIMEKNKVSAGQAWKTICSTLSSKAKKLKGFRYYSKKYGKIPHLLDLNQFQVNASGNLLRHYNPDLSEYTVYMLKEKDIPPSFFLRESIFNLFGFAAI